MKIRYLGTAAAEGWPALFCTCMPCQKAAKLGGKNIRTRSQAIIDNRLLIDFPADSYLHVLSGNLTTLPQVHSLLITHSHSDHFYPEDIMMRTPPYFLQDNPGMLTIYGNDAVEKQFNRAHQDDYNSQLPNYVTYCRVNPYEPFETAEGYRVTALLADHNKAEACYFYLIEKDGQALLYAHDTGLFPEASWEYLKGKKLDYISYDATHGNNGGGVNHMGFSSIYQCRQRLEEMGCLKDSTIHVANHFSHGGGLLHEEMEEFTRGENLVISYDGMTVDF